MVHCQNCSAPLAGFTSLCGYCGSHNDLDRNLLVRKDGAARASAYACPACGEAMENLLLGPPGKEPLAVDQCGACFGLLFPFYRLEAVLNDLARYEFLVDAKRLDALGRNAPAETRIAYRKCPVCSKLMNRINFGKRSGVITDQCHGHGVWLDAGELKRLVEWKDSGGQIVDDGYRQRAEAEQAKRREKDKEKIARWNREADAAGG